MDLELFRYQILPISSNLQVDAFGKKLSTNELKNKKNEIFFSIINSIDFYRNGNKNYPYKNIISTDPWFVLKLGSVKHLIRENEKFEFEELENYPSVSVIINNSDDIQIAAISANKSAFSSGKSVANIIQNTVNESLSHYGLECHFKPIVNKNDFWKIINDNTNKIESIDFELISPNMAKISESLTLDLKAINQETNMHKTNVKFEAPAKESLVIETNNETINSFVEYSSRGGGEISVKIKGMKKKISTSKEVKTIKADNVQIENLTEDSLNLFFKNFFNKL